MWRVNSLGKTLILGKIEGGGEGSDGEWDGWMASLIQWTWVSANSKTYSGGQGSLVFCSPWGRKESDIKSQHHWATEQLLLCFRDLYCASFMKGNVTLYVHWKKHTHNVIKWALSMNSAPETYLEKSSLPQLAFAAISSAENLSRKGIYFPRDKMDIISHRG